VRRALKRDPTVHATDDEFEFGLELMLLGLERKLVLVQERRR
jgi:hypothetical protein